MSNKKLPAFSPEELEKLMQQLDRRPAPQQEENFNGFVPWNVSKKKPSVKRIICTSLPEDET